MRQVLELWKQSGILAGMHLNLGRGEFLEAIRFAREHEMHAYEQRAQASLRHSLQELHEEAPMHP